VFNDEESSEDEEVGQKIVRGVLRWDGIGDSIQLVSIASVRAIATFNLHKSNGTLSIGWMPT